MIEQETAIATIWLLVVLVLSNNPEVFGQPLCPIPQLSAWCMLLPNSICLNGGTCSFGSDNCAACNCSTGFTGEMCGIGPPTFEPFNTTQPSATEEVTTDTSIRGLTRFSSDGTCHGSPACNNSIDCGRNGRRSCKPGWGVIATGCCFRCDLDCGVGTCFVQKEDDVIFARCDCPRNYSRVEGNDPPCVSECDVHPTKLQCITPEPPKNYVPIIAGSVIGAVVFLLVVFGVTLWFFYKKRMTWALKFVYYMSSYADNDDLDYDAFISYKSDGIGDSFVTQLLYKKLEDEFGYTCVFHARNFVPGKMIIDNILEAINNCRRVILVLTKDYLSSEWCHLEVSVAQQRMMERKTRILPIMLEDITDALEEYPNLKFILKHVTYLEVPKSDTGNEDFWEKLRFAMPRTKEADERSAIHGCACLKTLANLFKCKDKSRLENIKTTGYREQRDQYNVTINEAFTSEVRE